MKSVEVGVSERLQPVPLLGWQVAERLCRDERGVRDLVLEIRSNGTTRTLREVVDTSRGPGEHRIWLLVDDTDGRVAVLGGLTAYWLDRSGKVAGSERLFREARDEEYWDLNIVFAPAGAVVVYEGGAMFLEPNLKLRWHVQKRYNDVFEKIDGEGVYFLAETGECWSVP